MVIPLEHETKRVCPLSHQHLLKGQYSAALIYIQNNIFLVHTFTVRLSFSTSAYAYEIKLRHFSGYDLYPLVVSSFPAVIHVSCRVGICHNEKGSINKLKEG